MATLSEMLGIMQTGGTAIRQGFSEGMDRKRQSMLDANELERQKRLDEQNKKESDARLGLVELQTKSARRDLDQAMEGDAESKNLIGGVRETMQRDIEEFSKNVTTPEDEQILKQAKDNFRMVNAMSKYDQEKAAKFAVGPFELKQQMEAQKQKALRENEKFGLEKSKTQAEVGATKALEKERIAGSVKNYADAGKTKREMELLGVKTGENKDLQLSVGEKEKIAGLGEAVRNLQGLREMFKEKGMGAASSSVSGAMSGLPLIGQRIAPESAAYKTQAKQVAENFLRAATGAAAPAEEVKLYASFLPQPGDTPELAEQKINTFAGRVRDKAKGVSDRMRIEGANDKAAQLEQNMDELINSVMTKPQKNIRQSDDDLIKKYSGGGSKSFTPSWGNKGSGSTGGY